MIESDCERHSARESKEHPNVPRCYAAADARSLDPAGLDPARSFTQRDAVVLAGSTRTRGVEFALRRTDKYALPFKDGYDAPFAPQSLDAAPFALRTFSWQHSGYVSQMLALTSSSDLLACQVAVEARRIAFVELWIRTG